MILTFFQPPARFKRSTATASHPGLPQDGRPVECCSWCTDIPQRSGSRHQVDMRSSREDLKGAGSDISFLAQELQDYEDVLGDLARLKETIKQSSDDTIREAGLSLELSRQCLAELKDLYQLLEKARAQLAGGRTRQLWYRVDWATRKKRQIEAHTARVAAQKSSLISCLGVLQRFEVIHYPSSTILY